MDFSSWPAEPDEPPAQPEPLDKPKKPRHRHTALQLAALNELYDRNEHPSLDERTALAERLEMETKTVNAWFQNKRASSKKRHRGAPAAPLLDLPPISAILASTSTSSSHSPPPTAREFDDYSAHESLPMLPPPRLDPARSDSASPMSHGTKATKQDQGPQQQTAFYAGNPEHRHTYESASIEPPPRPRMRMRPTSYQTDELRKFYLTNSHPTKEEREDLGKRIGMRYQSVTNWFQNQRSLAKKRQEEEDDIEKPHVSRAESGQAASEAPPQRLTSMSIASLIHRDKSPSVDPSIDSASSRASPYRITVPAHRPRRTRPEPHQLDALQKLYNRTSNPSIEERGALALEVGMDLAKVTNWFRNLRQTARKRAKKPDDDGDTDSVPRDSASVSRAATPSAESSSTGIREYDRSRDVDTHLEPMVTESDLSKDTSAKRSLSHARIAGAQSEPSHDRDVDMDTEVDELLPDGDHMELDQMDEQAFGPRLGHHAHSDAGTDDEEYQEVVTPSPSSSPSPAPPSFAPASFSPQRRQTGAVVNVDDVVDVKPEEYARLEKIPGRVPGVRVEDALLLLGFHHHIAH
ncbi:hypothetical protein FA95DRAFT_907820 [Auriscalpium vulgare]|uniref:Uncharacterized protein n=1 Tax=Auriscalpium vulgare TaxID=40419 RepID=A0ACB8RZK7_9AGAM|nr:hypothetical protein FA95DRAFT_907820 [Auriscalpium vulgare]